MKKKIVSFCLLLAVVANMAFIFYNSAQTAEQSGAASKGIAASLLTRIARQKESAGKKKNEKKNDEREQSAPPSAAKAENTGSADAAESVPASATPTQAEINALDAKLRNYSHALEFSSLGLLLLLLLMSASRLRLRSGMLFAFLFCLLYALSDECHQLFSDGRAFEVKDICADSAGAALGILCAAILLTAFFKKRASQGTR